ncbi:hypothetical protein LT330_003368 [Penicillium expansum]|nr:hypothetical protein LT330_003368 [Penicillium expansum]
MTKSTSSKTVQSISVSGDKLQPSETWVGLTDPDERRRRQNRINQRAYRMRKRLGVKKDSSSTSVKFTSSTSSIPPQDTASLQSDPPKPTLCRSSKFLDHLLEQLAQSAYRSYVQGDPRTTHFLTLARVNIFRAFMHNMKLIGWSPNWIDRSTVSDFSIILPQNNATLDDCSHIPFNLRPTRVQRTMPHHPWLDFFPLPKMRDNLIEAGKTWNEDELWNDIMGFWDVSNLDAGLLVWGEPWDVRNWEVTEPFLKKWQWVLRNCPELMQSTNYWRTRRGEQLIFRYI